MLLSDLIKRKEYNYPDDINFDSLSNQYQLHYPVNKFFVGQHVDEQNLLKQIKNYAIDYKFKSVKNLYLICVSFHCLDDFEAFDDEINNMNLTKFDIEDSKDIAFILPY